MTAKVVIDASDPFLVNAGVINNILTCILHLNLFLVAVTLAFQHGVSLDDGVGINYTAWMAASSTFVDFVHILKPPVTT